ncbi:MAG: hypothetical protein AAF995_02690 [Planctomycetota bacterium]
MGAIACKLAVVVFACGACGGGLLASRHARIQSAHELAEAKLRMRQHRIELDRLRNEIDRLSVPTRIATTIAENGIDAVLNPAAEAVYEPPLAVIGSPAFDEPGLSERGFGEAAR